MPRDVFGRGFAFLPRQELLTFEELARLARVFAGLGVRKLRLTGGEPLLRRDLERLVAMLAAIDGIRDIALTTNGALLAGKAETLAAAGLRRAAARSASSPRSPSRFAAAAPGPGCQPTASSTPACSPEPDTTCAARCAAASATRRCASR